MANQESLNRNRCFRCGECCRRFQVLLDRSELQRLAHFLAISPADFIARYSDPRWPGHDRWLIKQIDSACPFLRGGKREYICSVHSVKPDACSEWAASYSKPECREGLERYWRLDFGSSGLIGSPQDIKSFTEFLNHSAEKPNC